MFGRMCDKQTLIYSSVERSLSLFLFLILFKVAKPNSHKQEVENCERTNRTFSANARYSFCIVIQNVSISTAECFILGLMSLEMVANSSSFHNLNPILEGTSTKGLQTQSYFSVFSDGK